MISSPRIRISCACFALNKTFATFTRGKRCYRHAICGREQDFGGGIGCEMLINLQRMHTENFLILFNTDLRVARGESFSLSLDACDSLCLFGEVCLFGLFPTSVRGSHNINLHICHRLESRSKRASSGIFCARPKVCNAKAKNVR